MTGVRFNEEQIARGLTAVVVCAGNFAAASRFLENEGLTVKPMTLRGWCQQRYPERYAELRERYAAELETHLIHDMRDLAVQGMEIQRLALDKTYERLVSGRDDDPSKTAANVSRVVQTNVDKMLAVSGRPTSIREDRNLGEVLRSLAAKGIIELPPEDVTEEMVEIPGVGTGP